MMIEAIHPIEIFKPLSNVRQVAAQEKLGDMAAETVDVDRVSLGNMMSVPPIKKVERNPGPEFSGGESGSNNSDSNLQSTQAMLAVEEQGSFQPRTTKKNDKPESEREFIFLQNDNNDILSFVKSEPKPKVAVGTQSLLKSPIDDGFLINAA